MKPRIYEQWRYRVARFGLYVHENMIDTETFMASPIGHLLVVHAIDYNHGWLFHDLTGRVIGLGFESGFVVRRPELTAHPIYLTARWAGVPMERLLRFEYLFMTAKKRNGYDWWPVHALDWMTRNLKPLIKTPKTRR